MVESVVVEWGVEAVKQRLKVPGSMVDIVFHGRFENNEEFSDEQAYDFT